MADERNAEYYKSGRKKKRHSSYILLYIALIILAIILITVLSLTVLFPIKNVEISGKSDYKSELIADASKIEMNTNLFTSDMSQVESNITEKLPYIESVKIGRKFPSTIVLNVTKAAVYAQIESGGKYVLINSSGKCLEIKSKISADVPVIRGMSLKDAVAGKEINFDKNESALSLVHEIMQQAEKNKLQLTVVNVSDSQNIWATHQNKIVLLFGSESNLSEKFDYAVKVLNERKNNTEEGTLNLSRIPNSKNQASFISGSLKNEQKR